MVKILLKCLLGVLISCWPEKIASMWTNTGTSEKNSEQPSMLAVCPAVPWFPLLPVVLPSNSAGPTPQQTSQDKTQV